MAAIRWNRQDGFRALADGQVHDDLTLKAAAHDLLATAARRAVRDTDKLETEWDLARQMIAQGLVPRMDYRDILPLDAARREVGDEAQARAIQNAIDAHGFPPGFLELYDAALRACKASPNYTHSIVLVAQCQLARGSDGRPFIDEHGLDLLTYGLLERGLDPTLPGAIVALFDLGIALINRANTPETALSILMCIHEVSPHLPCLSLGWSHDAVVVRGL